MNFMHSPLVSMFAALVGNAILSLGLVLQKRHVAWLSGRYPGRARDAAAWILGFVLMNIQPVFVYLALTGLAANVVAAAGGASVAFTALFSVPLLGERLTRRRAVWTLALFAALAAAGLRGGRGSGGISPLGMYAAFAIPAGAVGALAVFERSGRPSPATAFAAAAGAFSGFMVLAMDGLKALAAGGLAGWVGSPFLYLYIAAGVGAFAVNQIAYRKGSMAAVAPAFYGMQVLWPALCAYFVTGAAFDAPQALAFIAIAASIIIMSGERT